MRTALFLLLLLAMAAVPGSLYPQRSSDPNGVTQYFAANKSLAPVLDSLKLFDVYSSAWFSAIYLLLFVSLVGCVVPRTIFHAKALVGAPPRTPARLERLAAFRAAEIEPNQADAHGSSITAATAIDAARTVLRKAGYRVRLCEGDGLSASAERGYMRETGNLIFHISLIGILIAIGIGGGYGYTGQRVLVTGQAFANVPLSYDSLNRGRFFDDSSLEPYRIILNKFSATYEKQNLKAYGQPIDYTASVTTYDEKNVATKRQIKVNYPLEIGGSQVYLLGNGYAPSITVRDKAGTIVFSAPVPFLPQDANLTSVGIIKVPDGLPVQLGMVALFYPTSVPLASGALGSSNPDLLNPELALRVYKGDLGINSGSPKSVYALNTDTLTLIAGAKAEAPSILLKPGETKALPENLGTISFNNMAPTSDPTSLKESVQRFASLDIHRDPSQGWVLFFAVCVLIGLLTSLFIPRRRLWVKAIELADGRVRLEYAGLARGEDPQLEAAVADLADRHSQRLGLRLTQ